MRIPHSIARPYGPIRYLLVFAATVAFFSGALAFAGAAQQPQTESAQREKLPRPRTLGRGVKLERDPATGELREARPPVSPANPNGAATPPTIRTRVNLVELTCNVFAANGTQIRGLAREDFRVWEDGVEQAIAHFDASSDPASIALVLDASPSVYRELAEMKAAARTLAKELSPHDDVAVVAFAGEARLLLPFTSDRALLERAIASPGLAQVADSSQSNIYQVVYLAARELFRGRTGRKAIVLLTDGQDSGLGLAWDPSSALPHPGKDAGRLSFEDVARELAADAIEVYAVSTQPRPRAMTEAWLEARRSEMLVTPAARELGMPHYTLYLAELVRRAGGRIYFLSEIGALSEVYRRIAERLGAQYTLGYYPAAGIAKPGWRTLRVELRGRGDARVAHRVSYYVSASLP